MLQIKRNNTSFISNGKYDKNISNNPLGKHIYDYGSDMVLKNEKYLETQEDKANKFYPRAYYLPPKPKPYTTENAIQKHLKDKLKTNIAMIEEKKLLSKRESPLTNDNDITPIPNKALPPVVNLEPKIKEILEPIKEDETNKDHSKISIKDKKPISTQDYEIQPTKTQFKSNFRMEEE